METPTPIQIALIVGGATLFLLGLIILLLYSVYRNRKLTAENEADHEIHVARTAAANKERDTWKTEATKLATELHDTRVEKNGANASYKAANMELYAAKGELNSVREELEAVRLERYELLTFNEKDAKEIQRLNVAVDEAYKTLEAVNKDRDELNRKCNTLAEMVRTLTDMLAAMNAAVDSLVDKRVLNGSKQARVGGKFSKVITTVDEQKEYKTVRSVKDLKITECIQVNNSTEERQVLQLFADAGITWVTGKSALERGYENKRYPLCLSTRRNGKISQGVLSYWKATEVTILPASDFIDVPAMNVFVDGKLVGTAQDIPAPTPVKQLSEVVKEMEKPETIEPTEHKDHPCLKGCRKPKGCKCPDGVPKGGSVLVTHTKSDLIVMGVALDVNDISDFNKEATILEPWQNKRE